MARRFWVHISFSAFRLGFPRHVKEKEKRTIGTVVAMSEREFETVILYDDQFGRITSPERVP